jgi:hypothetical protein
LEGAKIIKIKVITAKLPQPDFSEMPDIMIICRQSQTKMNAVCTKDMKIAIGLFLVALYIAACGGSDRQVKTADIVREPADTVLEGTDTTYNIRTGSTTPDALISFARTLQGTPYRYASSDPSEGFDCSGFITYVFNHFGIGVPRRSVDFSNVKKEVPLSQSLPGDLILFTGTDSTERVIGHMGIITQNSDSLVFIHSTSGKAYGVTETPLNSYYQGRFVKVVRVFDRDGKL